MPRVTVLVTTYNGMRYLRQTLDSVAAQTFRDFELLVVDDGSTDGTPELVAAYPDKRLRFLATPRNLGVVGARNFGVSQARGDYIAPLDHDDLACPTRLAVQSAYLDAHPGTVAVSAAHTYLGGRFTPKPVLTDPYLLRFHLHLANPLAYSSLMLRTAILPAIGGFVRPEVELADDFDLYHRLLAVGTLVQLPDTLLRYRIHTQNASLTAESTMVAAAVHVLTPVLIPYLGDRAAEAAALFTTHFGSGRPVPDTETFRALADLFDRLIANYPPGSPREQTSLRLLSARLWTFVCARARAAGHPWAGDYADLFPDPRSSLPRRCALLGAVLMAQTKRVRFRFKNPNERKNTVRLQ